jgi:hypothetical protein
MYECEMAPALYKWLISPRTVAEEQAPGRASRHPSAEIAAPAIWIKSLGSADRSGGPPRKGLVRRVDPVAQEAYEQAPEHQDTASKQLTEAVDEGVRP